MTNNNAKKDAMIYFQYYSVNDWGIRERMFYRDGRGCTTMTEGKLDAPKTLDLESWKKLEHKVVKRLNKVQSILKDIQHEADRVLKNIKKKDFQYFWYDLETIQEAGIDIVNEIKEVQKFHEGEQEKPFDLDAYLANSKRV